MVLLDPPLKGLVEELGLAVGDGLEGLGDATVLLGEDDPDLLFDVFEPVLLLVDEFEPVEEGDSSVLVPVHELH